MYRKNARSRIRVEFEQEVQFCVKRYRDYSIVTDFCTKHVSSVSKPSANIPTMKENPLGKFPNQFWGNTFFVFPMLLMSTLDPIFLSEKKMFSLQMEKMSFLQKHTHTHLLAVAGFFLVAREIIVLAEKYVLPVGEDPPLTEEGQTFIL